MKVWSAYQQYSGTPGMPALWMETFGARQVFTVRANTYSSQQFCFKACIDPMGAINAYLTDIYRSALRRGYEFLRGNIGVSKPNLIIRTSSAQINSEIRSLSDKLNNRYPYTVKDLSKLIKVKPQPVFKKIKGDGRKLRLKLISLARMSF